MSGVDLVKFVAVQESVRMQQVQGYLDLPQGHGAERRWRVEVAFPEGWSVGAIVGPSGSGKTVVGEALWPGARRGGWHWGAQASVLDGFRAEVGVKELVEVLTAVGLGEPGVWMRPYRVLSTGEKVRADLARALVEEEGVVVVEDWGAGLGREAGQASAAAAAKVVRRRGRQVVVMCRDAELVEWWDADWVVTMPEGRYTWRGVRGRPDVAVRVQRVERALWQRFREYHPLDTRLNPAARCYGGYWGEECVVFASFLPMPWRGGRKVRREHRTVCLPPYQGLGLGRAVSGYVAAMCKGLGYRYVSITAHPGFVGPRLREGAWRMTKGLEEPRRAMAEGGTGARSAFMRRGVKGPRWRATLEYVGPALAWGEARAVWGED